MQEESSLLECREQSIRKELLRICTWTIRKWAIPWWKARTNESLLRCLNKWITKTSKRTIVTLNLKILLILMTTLMMMMMRFSDSTNMDSKYPPWARLGCPLNIQRKSTPSNLLLEINLNKFRAMWRREREEGKFCKDRWEGILPLEEIRGQWFSSTNNPKEVVECLDILLAKIVLLWGKQSK